MIFPHSLLIVSLLLLGTVQSTLAVQPLGQVSPGPGNTSTKGIVDRGGTIEVIDPAKNLMVVDGVSHPFSAARVKIYFPPSQSNAKTSELKVGMQIRFRSALDAVSGQNQIREIWVTSVNAPMLQR